MSTEGAIEIRVTLDELALLPDMMQRAVNSAMYAAAQDVEREAVQFVPMRTGRLLDSMQVSHSTTDVSLRMDPVDEYGHHYGRIVEMGAAPHTIAARGDRPLRFRLGAGGGFRWITAWEIEHPGYGGRDFLGRLRGLMIERVRLRLFEALMNIGVGGTT